MIAPIDVEPIQYHKNVILIVGNPNVGKTSIFNQLSHKYAITANYPFTTIELNTDHIELDGKQFEIIDTAGIYRLDHPSEEGQITRDLIFQSHPEILIQVIEAANLEQSLLLTAQLLELQIPLVLVLNMIDETARQGVRVNTRLLAEKLGVPVIETIATEGKGIEALKKAISQLKPPTTAIRYPALVERLYHELFLLFPPKNKLSRALISLLVLDDPYARQWLDDHYGTELRENVLNYRSIFLDKHFLNPSIAILNFQQAWVQDISRQVIKRKGHLTLLGLQKFGEWARHPWYGWLIVLIVIAITYLLVGKFGAVFLVNRLEQYIFSPISTYLERIIPWPLVQRLLVGDYGLLTTGLFNAIGTVLPIITLFFLVLNFLEDIGYLTNLIVLTNRVFQTVGLSGKAILPLVLGFGCKTMATLSTKILDSKKEKYIAIFLIGLAIPCSSQMSVIMAVLALQPIVVFAIVAAALLTIEMTAGLILNRLLPEEPQPDFIISIPPIRLPDFKLLLQKTYYRTQWFVKEAVPLFLFGAFILFLLHETGGMRILEWLLRPIIVVFLDLPIKFSEALVLSLARSEAGAVLVMDMVKNKELTSQQLMVAIIVLTLFVPCISDVMAMIKVLKVRKALTMVFIITGASFLIGGLMNYLLHMLSMGGFINAF